MTIPLYDSQSEALERLLPWIGTLVYSFAHLESVMTAAIKTVMIRQIGLRDGGFTRAYKASHAIIGANRFSASRDMWKRLLVALDASPAQIDYYNKLFSQLGEISAFRDRLAHQYTYQATPEYTGLWINSDIVSIRQAGTESPIVFPVKVVAKAASDLTLARDCFDGIFEHHVIGADRRCPYDLTQPTWKYKPAMLVRGNRSVEALLEGRSPPPQSWTE